MQHMRDVIQQGLARTLRRLPEEDRLRAALPVVCGPALASHCEIQMLDAEGVLHLLVDAPDWLRSLQGMGRQIQAELQRVAGVPLSALHCKEIVRRVHGGDR